MKHWYRVIPLPEDDEFAQHQCSIEHSYDQPFTLIHYKYSEEDGKPYHWGLYKLLEELSRSCPYTGKLPTDTMATRPSLEASQLEPFTESSQFVIAPLGSESTSHSHTQVTEDFNQILDRVEAVLRQDNPSDQDIDWVISQTSEPAILDFAARMLTDHPDLLKGWFPIFFSARLLSAPQFAVLEGEGGIEPYWHTGGILITAASQSHPLIETVLQSFRYVGPNAKLRLLSAFLEIRDVELVASLVPTVRGWLTSGPPVVLDYGVPGLGSHVVSMLQARYEVQAAELLNAMLEQKNQDNNPRSFRLAESIVSQYWVNYLVTHILPLLAKVNPSWLVEVLESKLRQVTEWELGNHPGYAPPEFVRSPGFMPRIDEAGGDHSPLADQLVGALRDAMEALISVDTTQAGNFISRWLQERILVFRRLAFHLLAKHGESLGQCCQLAVKRENFSLAGCRYEYREFLKSQFRLLPEDQQRQIEDWILTL